MSFDTAQHAPEPHVSVMVREVIEHLALKDGDMVVDATLGQGGHSAELLSAADIRLLSLDADAQYAQAGRERLARFAPRATVVNANFADLADVLREQGIEHLNKALFDLGWNRGQLSSGRGFSFLSDEPLNMSYAEAPRSGFTARDIVNTWDEPVLADVLYGYGEERYARRIAHAIVEVRAKAPIETTAQLTQVIRDAVPAMYRRGRLNPATKTFQALRIAVNNELGVIDAGIRAAWERLSPGGRVAVITFHSVEDRAVKRLFAEFAKEGGRLVLKKPLAPSPEELHANPSARSAKLRVIEKV